MNEGDEAGGLGEIPEAGGVLSWIVRSLLERRVVVWDIGQRRRALSAARVQCYVGMMMVMVQGIAHSVYKASRGAEPLAVDKVETLWLACGYSITLVWTFVVYLSMLHFTAVTGGPTATDTEWWWWWRLDSRSLLLVTHLAPLCCLAVLGQSVVALIYPVVYKDVLYTNFMNSMDEYYTSTPVRRFIDNIQETYQCCGLHSYQDWVRLRRVRGRGHFPFTCCAKGSLCDHRNVVNYLTNYKTWYETEDYSVMHTRVPYKERITNMRKVMYDIFYDELPFRDKGCGETLLGAHPFFWPSFFDIAQGIIIMSTMIKIRRYATATSFAYQAVQPRPRDYIMLSAAHACPCWALLRPTRPALWRWQRDYLTRMYFYLLHQGQVRPERYHDAIYPDMPLRVPDFKKSYDRRVRAYKSFLRHELGEQIHSLFR